MAENEGRGEGGRVEGWCGGGGVAEGGVGGGRREGGEKGGRAVSTKQSTIFKANRMFSAPFWFLLISSITFALFFLLLAPYSLPSSEVTKQPRLPPLPTSTRAFVFSARRLSALPSLTHTHRMAPTHAAERYQLLILSSIFFPAKQTKKSNPGGILYPGPTHNCFRH